MAVGDKNACKTKRFILFFVKLFDLFYVCNEFINRLFVSIAGIADETVRTSEYIDIFRGLEVAQSALLDDAKNPRINFLHSVNQTLIHIMSSFVIVV